MMRSNAPDITVIIPSYNHELYVAAAVASVLNSSFQDIELIVVDDGSTDGSVEILRAINDQRMRLVVQANKGAHAAMNLGAELASAPWLAFLNSDDLFACDKLDRHHRLHETDPRLEASASRLELIDQAGSPADSSDSVAAWYNTESSRMVNRYGSLYKSLLAANHLLTSSALFIRRDVFRRLGGFMPLRYAHDWFMFLTLAARDRFAVIEEPLVCYRLHGRNTIRENPPRVIAEVSFLLEWHISRALATSQPHLDPCEAVRIISDNSLSCPEIILLSGLCRLANANDLQRTAALFSQSDAPEMKLALALAAAYREREEIRHDLLRSDELLNQILQSRSWKLTAPLRRVWDYLLKEESAT